MRLDRVEPRTEGRAHGSGGRIGTGEHDLGAHAVVVELLVARRRVPATAQADLVEAVALVVLAEPLLLELVVADEVRRAGFRAPLVDEPLPLRELAVEVVAIAGIEIVAVHGRVRAGMTVGRDHDVVLHRAPPVWMAAVRRATAPRWVRRTPPPTSVPRARPSTPR